MKTLTLIATVIVLALAACDDRRESANRERVALWAETCVREQMSGLQREDADLTEIKRILGAVVEFPPRVKPIRFDELRGLRFAAQGEERMILCPVTYDAYIFNPLARPLAPGGAH